MFNFLSELFSFNKQVPGWVKWVFFIGVSLFFFTPLVYTNSLLYPHVQPQVYYLRTLAYGLLPIYVLLMATYPSLRPNFKNKANLLIFAYFGIQLITTFTGLNITRSLLSDNIRMGGLFTQLCYGLLFFYIQAFVKLFGQKAITYFYNLFLGVATLISFYALYASAVCEVGKSCQVTFLQIIEQFAPAQISATFGNPVYYGAFCIMPFALAVYLAWQSKSKWQKSLYGFMGFMQIVALNLTAARGATLGLLFAIGVAGILFFYFIRSPKIRSGIIAGLGLFTVLMLVAVLSPNFAKENVLIARLKVAANDPNLNMRMELWRMAYQGFKESPKAIFLGHGQENFPYAFNRYYEAEMYERDLTERQDKPHEFYLELLYSFGIFGFLVFMGLIAVFYWSLWQLRKREMLNLPGFIILSSGFAGYLLQYLAFFETTSPTVFYYIFFSTPIAWLALKDSVDTKKKLDLATSLLVAGGALIAVFIVLYYTVLSPSYLSRLQGKAAYALSVDKKVDQAFAYLEEIANDDSNFDKPAAAIRAMETTLALKNAVASGTQLPMDVVVKFEKLVIDTWEKLDLKYWNNSEHLGFYLWFKTIYSEDTNTPIDSNLDHLVERMQALGPEKAESYSYAAMYYKRKGDMQKAFDNAQKAISLNKDDGQSAWLTYQILRAAGKNDEAATTALSVMQRQLRFSPTNDDLVWLTSYLLDKKQYGPAGQLAGSLMQAKAGVPEIYPVVIRFLRETGKSEDATKVIEEAKKRFPQNQAIQSLK